MKIKISYEAEIYSCVFGNTAIGWDR